MSNCGRKDRWRHDSELIHPPAGRENNRVALLIGIQLKGSIQELDAVTGSVPKPAS